MLVCLLHIFVCLLVLDVSSSSLIISNLQRNKILSIFGFQGTICMTFCHTVGLSGLEPPTSRLSGVRSNRLSYKPFCMSGSHLSSRAVSSRVFSAVRVLTIVFGMGTGVSPGRIATRHFLGYLDNQIVHSNPLLSIP